MRSSDTLDGALPPRADTAAWAKLADHEASAAARALGLDFHDDLSTADCTALVALFDEVWETGSSPSVIDLSTVVALVTSGNLVMRARHTGEVVGGALGFFGPTGAPLHSHVVGVDNRSVHRGIGFAVKLQQRAWCLARGVDRMTWTYDPLVARNAYFNLVKLGAQPVSYHRDHYGVMRDGRNRGQSSDRLLVSWDLAAPVGRPATPAASQSHTALGDDGARPGAYAAPPPGHAGPVLVGVPRDVDRLRVDDPDLVTTWRLATRTALTDLMSTGWQVVGFDTGCHYVLEQDPRQETTR